MIKTRILLADDHEMVREGLKAILNAQPDMEVIAEAGDGRAAVSRAIQVQPDVAIMDLSMPKLNGLRATESLRRCCPAVKVLALTRHAEAAYLRQLMRAGAAGYALKQGPAVELLHAIRAVARGRTYLDPALAGHVLDSARRRGAANGSEISNVSAREEEVVRLVAWGYNNAEIAERLRLSVKTVETHKSNAMRKLSLRNRNAVIRFALMHGWLEQP